MIIIVLWPNLKKYIAYAKKYFSDYEIIPMLWSPIVKISSEKAKYNTLKELERLRDDINKIYKLKLELIINKKYYEYINQLKDYASNHTSEFKSSVMRLFQIEKSLEKHLLNLNKNKTTFI